MIIPGRPVHVTATAILHAGAGGTCFGVRLVGGADASVITIRGDGATGAILFTMKAGTLLVDEMRIPFRFEGDLHVTLESGTTPDITAFI